MRESYHTTTDTLDADSLPSTENCRVRFATDNAVNSEKILPTIFCIACISGVVVLGTRLCGTLVPVVFTFWMGTRAVGQVFGPDEKKSQSGPDIFSANAILLLTLFLTLGMMTVGGVSLLKIGRLAPMFQSLFIILGLVTAVVAWMKGHEIHEVVAWAVSGFLVTIALHILNHSSNGIIPFVVFALAGAGVCVLVADGIVTTMLGIATCQPRLSEETREDWHEQFGNAESRLSWYADGILVLITGLASAFFLAFRGQTSPGITALNGARHVLVACLVIVILLALLVALRQTSLLKSLSTFATAFQLFWQYDAHRSAAGVYQLEGIWHDRSLRLAAITGAIALMAAAILPAAAYFPLTLDDAAPWKAVVASSDETVLTWIIDTALVRPQYDEYRAARQQDLAGFLNSSSEAWIWIDLEGISRGRVYFLWTAFCSCLCCLIIPTAVAACVVVTISAPIVTAIGEEVLDDENLEFVTNWDGLIDQIQDSPDPIERNSLFVGVHADVGYPVIAHRSMLREHGHILGDTGSGKTAIGIAPMVTQLIRMAGRDATANGIERSSVVILDLKGDPAMFHGARIEAEDAGLPFRWFTNQKGLSTYVFNPFLQSHVPYLTTTQWSQTLNQALSTDYGEGYGQSFFSGENEKVLTRLLSAFDLSSFRQLSEYIVDGKLDLLGKKLRFTRKELDDAQALFSALGSLAPVEALNVMSEDGHCDSVLENQIDLPSVLQSPQVIYFYLRAGIEPSTVRRIGKLALQCLLSASANLPSNASGQLQTYLFIDEFQQIVSQNVELLLRQARSMNIATVLAHQTISDLMINDTDLTPTVQGNTRFKQYFAASDLNQQKTLIESSGETIDFVHSWSHGQSFGEKPSESFTESMNESIQPRITKNDIIRMTDDRTTSVVQLPRGSGYAQFGGFPLIIKGMYHITEDEYAARLATPWPDEADWPGTVTPKVTRRRPVRDAATPPPEPVPDSSDDSGPRTTDSGNSTSHGFEDVLDELDHNARKRRRKGRPKSRDTR